ncbi:SH3 domain-containing protein [Paraglaciecola aestuariivivens]
MVNYSKAVLCLVVVFGLLGCASNVSNSQVNFQSSGETLDLKKLKAPSSSLFVLFKLNKDRLTITDLKHSLGKYESIEIDQANHKLDFDSGDSLKGCLEIVASKEYKYCSRAVYSETNIDMGGVLVGTILYPIGLLSIASGNGGDFFTKQEIDSKAVYKIGLYLESELAKRRTELKQALAQHNSQYLKSQQPYFFNLVNQQEIQKAIAGIKNLKQLEQMQGILARLTSNEKVVTTAKLNVRKSNKPRAKIMGKLTKGQTFTPRAEKNGWYQVDKGWVSAKYAKDIKDNYSAQLAILSNQLGFANSSQSLLAKQNVSSTEISKVLNNKAALKGVSSTKIAKLKTLKEQAIEREKFNAAKRDNSIAAYNRFLKIYPTGDYAKQALALREPLWFNQAKQQNSHKAYRAFLDAYPQSQYFNQVRSSWLALAKQQNSVVAYQTFLNGYPVDAYSQQAHQKWFELAKQQHSISAYREFLKSEANTQLIAQASALLEPLWYQKIASKGHYQELSRFLIELPNSQHKTNISYAHSNCTRIARTYFTSRDNCVVNVLKLDELRKQNSFKGYAKAYAISGRVNDFNQAQKLASTKSEKQIIEYFAILALKDKSRLFDFSLRDQHQYLGSQDHATWFAQAKGSSKAKIKGQLTLKLKEDPPFEIKYGSYQVKSQLSLKAYYAKEVRSNWVGNSNTNPVEKESVELGFEISATSNKQTQGYDFGTYTIAYKDTGMMGGYTAYYLEREIEFSANVSAITPSYRLNVF